MTIEETRPFGTPDTLVPMGPRALTGADIIEALEAEIHARYKDRGGLKAFTTEFSVDYHTYRRYLKHERKMSADLLMDSLTALHVDPVVFFMQLRARIEAEGQ